MDRPALLLFALVVLLPIGCRHIEGKEPAARSEPTKPPERAADARTVIAREFRSAATPFIFHHLNHGARCPIVLESGWENERTMSFFSAPARVGEEITGDLDHRVGPDIDFRLHDETSTRVTLQFKRTELAEAVRLLAEQANVSVVVDQDVKGLVSFSLKQMPWRKALEAVVGTSRYILIEEDAVLRVVDPSTVIGRMETRVFLFKHIRPDELYRASVRYEPGICSMWDWDVSVRAFTLLDALRDMLTGSPRYPPQDAATLGKLNYDKDTNSVRVVDLACVLDRMTRAIRELDVESGR